MASPVIKSIHWILCNVPWFGLHLYAFHKTYNYSVAIHLLKLNLQRFANFVCNNDVVERFISCSLLPDTDVCTFFFSLHTNIADILRSPNGCSINVLMCQLLLAKAKKPQLYYIIQIMRESHRHHSLIRLIVKIDGFFMFSSELILKYESSHSVIACSMLCVRASERASERARVFCIAFELLCWFLFIFVAYCAHCSFTCSLVCTVQYEIWPKYAIYPIRFCFLLLWFSHCRWYHCISLGCRYFLCEVVFWQLVQINFNLFD